MTPTVDGKYHVRPRRDVQAATRVTADEAERIAAAAERERISVSGYIRRALLAALDAASRRATRKRLRERDAR
jgi:hypothetical protein